LDRFGFRDSDFGFVSDFEIRILGFVLDLRLGRVRRTVMYLFAHHIGVELFGKEFAPETPLEHVCAFAIMTVVLGLMSYGAYAAIRDFRRWRAG
jgi:hypothetical protein